MYLIGIDAGTTNIKAVLFDYSGHELKSVYKDNVMIRHDLNKVEMDMNELWENILEVLKKIADGIDPKLIKGIGLTAQGEGLWPIDKNLQAFMSARLWSDGRTLHDVLSLQESDLYQEIYNITGTAQFPGTALMHLYYLKKYEPELLNKIGKVFFCKDWIRYKLTGKVNLEYADAGTSLLDIKKQAPSKELFKKLGLEDYMHILPEEIVDSKNVIGTITDEVVKATGLSKDTVVGAGAIDIAASGIGVGAIEAGDAYIILGTTAVTAVVSSSVGKFYGANRFEKHPRQKMFIDLQATMYGTPNLNWYRDEFSIEKSFANLDESVSTLPAVPGGVLYHPYISPAGERAPFFDPNARASFFGISTNTRKEFLYKAILEGVAFSIKDCLNNSSPIGKHASIYITGGGANSAVWGQIISNITATKVVFAEGTEFAAKGAAGMLAIGMGIFKDFREMQQNFARNAASFLPQKSNTIIYQKYFGMWKALQVAFKPFWKERVKILREIGMEGF